MDKNLKSVRFGLKLSLLLLTFLLCTNLEIENVQCTSWEVVSSPTTATAYSVFMVSSEDGWIVCIGGPILRWNGVRWNNVTSPTSGNLTSVFMVSAVDGWAVTTDEAAMIRWDGTRWNNVTVPGTGITGLFSVFMVNADDGWAVGGGRNMLRWNGASWNLVPKPSVHWLYEVNMVNSNDGWAVGTGGTIIRWDGATWRNVTSPTSVILTSVDMVSANDGWAVGYNGTILRWDGAHWNIVPSPSLANFSSVYMINANEGYAISYSGTIIRWDGVRWNNVTSPSVRGLVEIFMLDSNEGWAVGTSGTIIRLSEKPPVANFSYSPLSPIVGEEVVFNASSSIDPDGIIGSYYWEFRDGLTGVSLGAFNYSSPVCAFTFPASGVYNVNLLVTDNSALTDSVTQQVTVTSEEFDLTIENEGFAGATNPDPGTYTYTEGADVEVWFVQIADGAWVFDYWMLDGVNVGSDNLYTVTMDNDHVLSAVSHRQYAFLDVTIEGSGTTFPPADTDFLRFDIGTQVTVSATPSEGWIFDHWELDNITVVSATPYTLTMNDNHLLTAVFVTGSPPPPPPTFNLTIETDGSGSTNPSAGDYELDEGSTVVVTAFPDADWEFNQWQLNGVNVGSSDSYSVLMNQNHVLSAVFTEIPLPPQYNLTVDIVGSGSTNPGIGIYMFDDGSLVNATAYPSDGWTLDCWMLDGQNIGDGETVTCVLGTNSLLTAVFTEIPVAPIIPPEYIPPLVGGGAGGVGGGYYAYRKFHPKSKKDTGKKGEKTEKEDKKEEKKKQRKRRKNAELELTIVDCPKVITGKTTGNVKVNIKNLGPGSTKNVTITVLSTFGLTLQNKTEKISSIQSGETSTKVFTFTLNQQAKRGEYILQFTAKGEHAKEVTEPVTICAIKIGLLTGSKKEQQLTHYKSWLRNNSLTWDELHNADNVMKLLSYDVILVASDLDMPPKWRWVLKAYVNNDRMLLKPKEKDSVEREISEKILALLKKWCKGNSI